MHTKGTFVKILYGLILFCQHPYTGSNLGGGGPCLGLSYVTADGGPTFVCIYTLGTPMLLGISSVFTDFDARWRVGASPSLNKRDNATSILVKDNFSFSKRQSDL